ncbi:MAG: DNA repair protein RecO [bacterium]
MNVTYATKAIVLNVQPWNDVDSRVIFYTQEQGKLELVARGTKKLNSKLSGHLQPFNLIDLMVINGRRLNYAGAASNLDSYANIKQNLDKLEASGYAINLFNRLIKNNEPDPEIFVLLKNFLKIIDQIESEPLFYNLLANIMLLQLLSLLGYKPEIDLDRLEISFIHQTAQSSSLSAESLQNLQMIVDNDLIQVVKQLKIGRQTAEQINFIINDFIIIVLDN